MDRVRTYNRTIFMMSVLFTGAMAGAFVWLLLFLINTGTSFIWDRIPTYLGRFYPLIVCIIGGVVIGLFIKRYGPYPEDMGTVMASVKENGRYGYDKLGRMSVGAILPLVFGGSVGPEAGLVGSIAAVCTWVGDSLRRFGNEFRELSRIGMYAALSAIFTAPLYGLFEGVGIDRDDRKAPGISKAARIVIYVVAISGAVATFLALSRFFSGGLSLPRYTEMAYGADEFLWLIPMALLGALAGWLFCVLDVLFAGVSERMVSKPVLKAVMAGLLLGACGMFLPFTLFAGEVQAEELNGMWMTMSVTTLFLTGFLKIAVTALCVNMGWRGGHFFPVIFSGISIGYGVAMILGIDPVFCVCAVTAATVGASMRNPVASVLILFLCFPLHSVLILGVGAIIGAYIPLPRYVRDRMHGTMTSKE